MVEKPIYNQKIVEKPIEKIVEKRVEVPIEKYVEVPKYIEVDKIINYDTKVQTARVVERKSQKRMRKSVRKSNVSRTQKQTYISLGESINKYKIDNIKLSLEIKSIQEQISEYTRISKNPELLKRENADLRVKIQSLEHTISSMRTENIHLESQTKLTKETQVIDVYSPAEISKLETDVRSLEDKNRRLRDVLAKIGISTTNVSTGNIKTTTINDEIRTSVYRQAEPGIDTSHVIRSTSQRRESARNVSKSPAPVRTTTNYTNQGLNTNVGNIRTSTYTSTQRGRDVYNSRNQYRDVTLTETRGAAQLVSTTVQPGTTTRTSHYGHTTIAHNDSDRRIGGEVVTRTSAYNTNQGTTGNYNNINQGTTGNYNNIGNAQGGNYNNIANNNGSGHNINTSNAQYEQSYINRDQPQTRTNTHYEGDTKVTTTTHQTGWQQVGNSRYETTDGNHAYTQAYHDSVRR